MQKLGEFAGVTYMRNTIKLGTALLLGATLTGCSMAGTGDFFADDYAQLQKQQMPQYHGSAQAASGVSCYPVSHVQYTQPSCGIGATYTGHGYTGQGYTGQGYTGQGYNTGPTNAYGQIYQGHQGTAPYLPNYQGQQPAYIPPSVGYLPGGLRGLSRGFAPHAYGTLGGVAYEAGEGLYGAQARLGYQFNRYLGVETEGSLGFSDTTKETVVAGTPLDVTLGVENTIAGFGVLRYPLAGKISGYSRLGYHRSELDQSFEDAAGGIVDTSFSTDGIAYGSGLEYAVSPKTALRLDYTVYDYDGPDADAISLAVSRKF